MDDTSTIDHTETRQRLLDTVAEISEELTARTQDDEGNGTLTAKSVEILETAGMFRLKLSRALGGVEADPTTQLVVIEALSYANPAAGWCAMVGSTSVAMPGAFLTDEAIEQMFPDGRIPRCAAVAMPIGKVEVVDGGYRLTGRWPFGSGVRHSEWIAAGATVMRGEAVEHRMMAFPTASAQIHDNWQVAGLKGTGSCDFSVDNLFIAEAFSWLRDDGEHMRGGPLYTIGLPGFVANEHAGFAIGVGRRALDSFVEREAAKARGYSSSKASLGARPAIQQMLGRGELRLRAARNLAIEINDAAYQAACATGNPSNRLHGEMRAVATHCTDVALDVVTEAFRYSGGGAIYQKNILQQCLRDMNVAAQHLMVSEMAYETLGQMILGVPDVPPM